MWKLLLPSILGLALLALQTEAFFVGPSAVGAAVGALFMETGDMTGTVVSGRRTRRARSYGQQSCSGQYQYPTTTPYYHPTTTPYRRTTHKYHTTTPYHHYYTTKSYKHNNGYQPYQKQHHYKTSSNSRYTQPPAYYYSSKSYKSNRGKREALEAEEVIPGSLSSFDSDVWFLEMLEMDQDDCTKRLLCEMAARNAGSGGLTGIEAKLAQAFGMGNAVDVSSPKALFDMAAQSGRLMGIKRCEDFYRRCETPVNDILEMIATEMKDMEKMVEEIKKMAEPMLEVERMEGEEMEGLARELNMTMSMWT